MNDDSHIELLRGQYFGQTCMGARILVLHMLWPLQTHAGPRERRSLLAESWLVNICFIAVRLEYCSFSEGRLSVSQAPRNVSTKRIRNKVS